MKKIVLTGANGFIGSEILSQLSGYEVIPTDLNLDGLDLRNKAEVFSFLKKNSPQAIIHVAGFIPKNEDEEREDAFSANVVGTRNILESMVELGIKGIVFSSSMSVYGKGKTSFPVTEEAFKSPETFYGLTKLFSENLVRFYAEKFGLSAIALRYAGVYGSKRKNGAVFNFISGSLSSSELQIKRGVDWDIVHVSDVSGANILALEKLKPGFEAINIGGGNLVNLIDLGKKIIELTNSASKIKIEEYDDPFSFCLDIKKAREVLGFSPLSLEEGLKKTIGI